MCIFCNGPVDEANTCCLCGASQDEGPVLRQIAREYDTPNACRPPVRLVKLRHGEHTWIVLQKESTPSIIFPSPLIPTRNPYDPMDLPYSLAIMGGILGTLAQILHM